MKFALSALVILLLLVFTACGTNEPSGTATVAPEATPATGNSQQKHTAYAFRSTLSAWYFIDNANNLRSRSRGDFVLSDVEELLSNHLARLLSGEIVPIPTNSGYHTLLYPYHAEGTRHVDDMDIRQVVVYDGISQLILDNQNRLWYFPMIVSTLSPSSIENTFYNAFELSHSNFLRLYEAVHGIPPTRPSDADIYSKMETYGYFRFAAPFVIMDNVIAIQQGGQRLMYIHKYDGSSYLFLRSLNPGEGIANREMYHEVFDGASDMFVDIDDIRNIDVNPIPMAIFSNGKLIYMTTSGVGRMELDINGNVHTFGRGTIGDGHGSTNIPRRADNVLSNVVQVGVSGDRFMALTNEGNLYLWGNIIRRGVLYVPTSVLENVSYIYATDNAPYVLMNNGEFFQISHYCQDEGLVKSLLLVDVKLPQRRIIGE